MDFTIFQKKTFETPNIPKNVKNVKSTAHLEAQFASAGKSFTGEGSASLYEISLLEVPVAQSGLEVTQCGAKDILIMVIPKNLPKQFLTYYLYFNFCSRFGEDLSCCKNV